ncbi:MAG: hypothetical protein KAX44_01155 [Candidatus Brocadiae bacterium]|nr:hypothetical protein [Candidatus Brocadiia bacterium]
MNGPRVMIVSHHFAPSSATGAIRSTRLARFLAGVGLPPVVVTAAKAFYGAEVHQDSHLREELDVFEVPLGRYVRRLESLGGTGRRLAIPALVLAYARGIERALRKRPDVDLLYFCGHPFWYFPLARHFLLRLGLPYVLDFEDVFYMRGIPYRLGRRAGLREHFDRQAEAWAVAGAAVVLHTTELQSRIYKERYKWKAAWRFLTVRWGYDEDALASLRPAAESGDGPFRIAIFGKLASYSRQDAQALASAVAAIPEGRPIQVDHLGAPEPELEDAFRRQGLGACFRTCGMQPYREGLRNLVSADCLVLNAISEVSIPAKTYDYIAVNRPIVAFVTPRSAAGRLLCRFSGAFLVQTAKQAERALRTIIQRDVVELSPGPDPTQFSQQYQFQKLLAALRALMQGRSVPCG